ncbi:MAG: V-type ATP synthase subunit E [Bacteroidetes bacterium]|jgi:V/A-type H+-transporting ATPase subunit E|uniref:V-type ATP synthase subunit E n=1 Tax=Candidatus Cryptobacteroides faecigallinarum TaxID=2840763 RepID=A0A9D9NHF3_9BACT|nr:V-type ATP synthase subunit E [Candidatus Cryptobacteroides faecigallinarum]
MQNKLQELTDKLYNEGLSKGKQEGEALLQEATAKADSILAEARKEADGIIAKARKEAEELKTRVNADLKMAANQSIAATKQDIEKIVVAKITDKEVKTALSSADFLKEIITAVARNFNAAEPVDLEVVLPESLKKEMEPFVAKELSSILKSGITASFSKKIGGGFTIGPKDGSYFISFTDETFTDLISEYLRPAAKKILFG